MGHLGRTDLPPKQIQEPIYQISNYLEPNQLTSVFEDQPSKNKALFNQNKGHLGSRYPVGLRDPAIHIIPYSDP